MVQLQDYLNSTISLRKIGTIVWTKKDTIPAPTLAVKQKTKPLMKWVGISDPDIYRVAFHSSNWPPKGRNRSFYRNKKMDQLLEQGFQAVSREKRKKIYDQVQLRIAQDFTVLPLWHDMEISVLQSEVKNYKIRFNGDFLSLPFVTKEEPP